ncbi:MAG: 3'(2'),5'-bisphosphate nucleotidase CysQ [Gammaproteobacteria bacterium]|jgi:3'(2'), 5'-bisphosphate nucleotidase
MNKKDSLDIIAQVVLNIVDDAAKCILFFYHNNSSLVTTKKSDNSPLSQADLSSNEIIISSLQKHFSYPILSEEKTGDFTMPQNDKFWVVDPLDGTKEFISGSDEFTINIALVENGVPLLGVVSVPAYNEIYYAIRGVGAFVRKNGYDRRINCSGCNNLKKANISISRSHFDPRLKQVFNKNNIVNVIHKGSAVKYCAIANGTADASIRITPLMVWDICASHCILFEAGGMITDFYGKELRYCSENLKFVNGIVASNCYIHSELLRLIKDVE